jgi:hypothetical protein
MRIPRFALKTLTLLAFATLSTLAVADDDVPGRVGRISLTQGQVSIGGDVGAEMSAAQVNWPVTSGTMVTTAPGARTELRIGSTSIRLDGESSLEVTQLDDVNLHLRLHYGSASVHVPNEDVVPGFELETPQARVRLQTGARVRVDAGRIRDTSAVEVFDGVALVDGGGSELTLRAGKGAEFGDDDVRTVLAQRDAFDDWSAARDRVTDNVTAARYVGTDMTGYEDLDRYGSWQTSDEYGPLWTPVVGADWVPYRDGSWAWIDPWGWTWVDNSPWGYAPFHYGRWVYVNRRWSWAPGRHREHPVWAPALVGWVGGGGRPASGWYPLSPHDRFVPSYRISESHVRWMNGDVRSDPRRPHDFRPQGLTVVPQDRFNQPGRVNVARTPLLNLPALGGRNAPPVPLAGGSAPPPPPNQGQRGQRGDRFTQGFERGQERGFERGADRGPDRGPDRGFDRGADRGQERGFARGPQLGQNSTLDTERIRRDGFIRQNTPVLTAPSVGSQPLGVISPTPHQPPQALGVTSPTPQQPPQALGITSPTPRQTGPAPIVTETPPGVNPAGAGRFERRDQFEEMREMRRARQPAQLPPAALGGQPMAQPGFEARPDRPRRAEWERPSAPMPSAAPAPAAIAPRPMMAPAPMPAPAPAAAPQPPARPAGPPSQRGGEEKRAHVDARGQHQQER